LQRQAGDLWQNVGECLLKRRSFPVTIGAGETARVVLMPDENSNSARAPGVYRLLFEYSFGSGNTTAPELLTSVSSTFRVNDMPARQAVSMSLDHEPILRRAELRREYHQRHRLTDSDLSITRPSARLAPATQGSQRLDECRGVPTGFAYASGDDWRAPKLPRQAVRRRAASFRRALIGWSLSIKSSLTDQAARPNTTIYTPEFAHTSDR
jgi:hypothetical protein